MLTHTQDILLYAQQMKFAVPGFNVTNMESAQAAINASEKHGHPVILQLGERYFDTVSVRGFAAMARAMAEQTKIPVALHLDHAYRLESVMLAIRNGFTSVMFDGSPHPLDENIKRTAEIVRLAHAAGVSVEAEIGSVTRGAFSDEEEGSGRLTDPHEAARFVHESGVDFLAAAIGTVHGMYIGEPHIDIDLLRDIRKEVSIPLVLHGGSGTPDDIVKACISEGICKININTEVSMAAVRSIAHHTSEEPNAHISKLMNDMQRDMTEVMEKFVVLCKNH